MRHKNRFLSADIHLAGVQRLYYMYIYVENGCTTRLQSCEFKVCLLTFKILRSRQPVYLYRLLNKSQTGATVSTRHDTDRHHLDVPRAKTSSAARSFAVVAPKLYNALPSAIKSSRTVETFKKRLKTHIFEKCFDIKSQQTTTGYRTH